MKPIDRALRMLDGQFSADDITVTSRSDRNAGAWLVKARECEITRTFELYEAVRFAAELRRRLG